MKFMLLALLSLSSYSVLADNGYDCNSSMSPQGGKFCHYIVPQCARQSCAEAALCAVEQYASNVTWDRVKAQKVTKSKTVVQNEITFTQLTVISDNDGETVSNTVTLLENKTRYDGAIVCEPVALNF